MTRQKVQMVRPFVFLCLLLGAFFERPLAASADIFHIFSNHFERVNSSDEIIFIQKGRDVKKINQLTNFALLSTEGEGRHGIYGELRAFIRTNDRPKAIIQIDGQTIAHQIYSEPFCWLKGICWSQSRTDTFVLCNDRFGPILRMLLENGCKKTDEKGKEMKIWGTEGAKRTGGWSTAFTGVSALSNGKRSKKDGKANNEEQLINIETMSEGEQRRKCQYRISCYEREGLLDHLSGKRQKQSGTLLSGKVAPPEGRKRTMKQMAKVAMKEVQRNEEEGKTKKEMDERDGETVLANYWNEREKKLRCKYRKSCYKTGQKATIERSALALWWEGTEERGGGEEGAKKQTEGEEDKAKWDKMGEKQRKAFCQYRKSCYESGRRTTAAEEERKEWQWDEMMDIEIGIGKKVNEYWSKLRRMVKGGRKGTERKKEENGETGEKEEEEEKRGEKAEEREEAQMRKKVDCKYRRSCYETGQLPEALKRQKETEEDGEEGTMGRKKVPSSVKELKLYCKYRKSCYVTSATATKITERRAENSGNRTNGERAESEQIEKIVGDGQRERKRQTKSMKNSEKTREGTEERDRGETQKRKTNIIRRKTKDKKEEDRSEEDGKGQEEKREETREEEREGKEEEKKEETREAEQEEERKGGAEEEEPNRKERREKEEEKREGREEGKRKDGRGESEQKDEEEEVEEEEKEKMEKKGVEKDERKKRQKRRKMNCSPEKLVKDKKEKVEGCKEKKNKEEEEASSVKEDEKKRKRKERKKTAKEREREEEEEEQMRKMRKRKKRYQRIKRGIRMMRHLGKEEEEEKREEQREKEREKKEGMEEEKEKGEEEEKNRSKLKKKRKKYKVEAAQENEKKTKVWERKWQGLSSAKRLECRYRKSCYATGTRQTIRRWTTGEGDEDERWGQNWQWTDLWAMIPWKYEKEQNGEESDGEKEPKKKWEKIEGWHGINERQKKFKCQYRKSCYERMEQQMERDVTGGEAQRSGRTEPKREKPKKAVDITQKTMAREADKRKRDETRRREALLKSTHLGIKLECKYRKSCYEERENRLMTLTQQQIVAPPPPINVAKKRNETKAQIGEAIARGGSQNCNQWRISCREAMGLTVREMTPIGKDGKKLCRKKNTEKEKRGVKW